MALQKKKFQKQFSVKILLEQLELLKSAQALGAQNLLDSFYHAKMCERLKGRLIRKKLKRIKTAELLQKLFAAD